MKTIHTILIAIIAFGIGIIAYYNMTESRECETIGHASQRLSEFQDVNNDRVIHTHRYIKN